MKKYILKIIIIALLFIPSISQAFLVYTEDVENITETSAKLRGGAGLFIDGCTVATGYSATTGLPCNTPISKVTAYFRYSKLAIPPIFCNDIFGSKMIATEDIYLGENLGSQAFFQNVINLTPDTDYYYCAIISNKDNIIYGGESIVKKFHTNPLKTRITTNRATRITSTSATLNGSYSSVKTVKTYFKYREDPNIEDITYFDSIKKWVMKNIINTAQAQTILPTWKEVGVKNHLIGNYSNLNENISFSPTGLKPSTKYIFMAETDDTEAIHIPGTPLSFTTAPKTGTGSGVVIVGNCYDGIKNGDETGIDTGGRCGTGNCYDGIQNGNETGIDIGGRCGSGGGYGNPFPQVTVTANPSLILVNETSTITWSSVNATSCDTFGNYGLPSGLSTPTSGSFNTGPLVSSKSYSVSCTGLGGTVSGSAYVYVNDGSGGYGNPFPQVTVTANPSLISPGGSSTITWSSTNATSCSSNSTSSTETSGNFDIGPLTSSKSYSVNCTGSGGMASGNAYVYVNDGSGWGGGGINTCPIGWTGTYPVCIAPNYVGTCPTGWTGTYPICWAGGNGGGIINTTPLVLGQTATPPNLAIVRYHEGIETVFTRQIMADMVFARIYGYVDGASLQTFAEDLSHVFAKTFGYIDANGREIRVSPPDRVAYQLQYAQNKLTVYEYFDNKIVDVRNVTTIFKNASDYEYYFKK